MMDTPMYAHLRELVSRRHAEARASRSHRHRGLQRSAREISLEVRRQRSHGDAA
jgi:hypothetical protein